MISMAFFNLPSRRPIENDQNSGQISAKSTPPSEQAQVHDLKKDHPAHILSTR